jgi:hypothetical protein
VPPNGSSPRKIEANRRNAQESTGPKTSAGKAMSSFNSTRHGLLSKKLPAIYGQGKRQYSRLLASLHRDLEPVGTLEEILVEKIAQEYWRLGVAVLHEGEAFEKENPFGKPSIQTIIVSDNDQPLALSSHEPTREIAATPQGGHCASVAQLRGLLAPTPSL